MFGRQMDLRIVRERGTIRTGENDRRKLKAATLSSVTVYRPIFVRGLFKTDVTLANGLRHRRWPGVQIAREPGRLKHG